MSIRDIIRTIDGCDDSIKHVMVNNNCFMLESSIDRFMEENSIESRDVVLHHLESTQNLRNIKLVDDEDLNEAIEVAGDCTSNVRNRLMEILWLKVVYYFVDTMGCSREVFDCYINGSLDTHFYYNGTEVKSEEELLELVNAA